MDLLTTISHHLMAVMLGTWGTAIYLQPSTMFKLAHGILTILFFYYGSHCSEAARFSKDVYFQEDKLTQSEHKKQCCLTWVTGVF
jgi:hypothetical protein